MSQTAYRTAATGANATPAAGQQWNNPQNGRVTDGVYATNFYVTSEQPYFNRVQLLKGGVMQSTNRAATPVGFYNAGPSPFVFGGATDLWGSSWVGTDFDDPNFGIAIALGADGGKGGTASPSDFLSGYLVLTNFASYGIPATAVIQGIQVSIDAGAYSSGGGTQTTYIDGVQIRIYYTFSPTITAVGDSAGVVYSQNINVSIPDKRFDFNVFGPNQGAFMGKWREPATEPSFKLDKNNILSSMQVTLPVNDVTSYPPKIGPGTIIEVNNEVEIIAYYGNYDAMVDETGEPMVDEDFNLVIGANGAPEGDTIFTGYVSRWDLDFGNTDSVVANLLTHSNELFNIMLETNDTPSVVNLVPDGGFIGIAGAGPTDNGSLAQVMVATATGSYSRITMPIRVNFAYTTISLGLSYGNNPSSPGPGIGNAIGVQIAPPDSNGYAIYAFVFGNAFNLNNGDSVIAYLDVNQAKTGGNVTYPADFQTGTSYSPGKAWVSNKSTPWAQQSNSLLFTLWLAGGSTDVTYSNMDPSDILKSMIDFAAARGSRIRYTKNSITPTATRVTAKFKAVSVGEGVQGIPDICPADWFVAFDPGSNIVYLSQRPGVPNHIITMGQNVSAMKLSKSIENLINQDYFSGGGNPALYVKQTDQAARNAWRPGLGKTSNNNVTDVPTARLIAQSVIDRNKNPNYYGSVNIFAKGYFIEDVLVGELLAFMNAGALVDTLLLQAASITYHPDYIEIPLDNLPPKTEPQVDDIQRELKNIAAEDNPATPQ